MTPDTLARWQALAEKATSGEWWVEDNATWLEAIGKVAPIVKELTFINAHGEGDPRHGGDLGRTVMYGSIKPADAAFIAEARTAVPALIQAYREQVARVRELEAALREALEAAGPCSTDYPKSSTLRHEMRMRLPCWCERARAALAQPSAPAGEAT